MRFIHSHSPGAALLCTLILCLLATGGCVRPEGDEVHIQFSFWGSVEQQKVEREIIAGFEAAHPGVRIDMLPIGHRYTDKIQAMMVGNVAPDVIMIEMSMLDEWSSRGVLLDLTEDMQQIMEGKEIMPIPLKAVERDGKFFAAPVNVSGTVTFVNLTALAKAGIELPADGLTWDFIEEIAPKLSRRSANGDPNAPTDYALLLPDPIMMAWASGGEIFDNPRQPTKIVVNSPQTAEALERFRRILRNGFSVPPDILADQGTFQLFRDGKIAFYFDGRWRTPDFRRIDGFEWDVVPVPSGKGGNRTRHGGTFIGISAKTKHPELARKFLHYYAAEEGVLLSMRGGRTTPVFRDLAYGEEFLHFRPPESMEVFSGTMEEGAAAIPLYAPGLVEVSLIIDRRMQQAIAYPNLPVQTVLEGLEKDLNRWLNRRREKLGAPAANQG